MRRLDLNRSRSVQVERGNSVLPRAKAARWLLDVHDALCSGELDRHALDLQAIFGATSDALDPNEVIEGRSHDQYTSRAAERPRAVFRPLI